MNRKDVLLKAAYELLRKCDSGPYVKHALTETVFYDGAYCDGSCLMEDIRIELMEAPCTEVTSEAAAI